MKKESVQGTPVQGARLVLIIVSLMASLLLAALDSTIVSTAMKTIVNQLQGIELYAWPFTIYMLSSTVIIPISGGLADIFGRKPIFLIGIFTFLAGSALCGFAQSMLWLILCRGIQGLGGGILTTSVFTIVADLFPPQLRGKYMGIVTSVFGISSIIGPLIGGLITDYIGWHWIFFINIPIGIIAVILILLFMPNFKTAEQQSKIDFPGTLFIILTLVPMLLAFSWAGSTYSWGSIQVIGLLVFSAAMLVVFVRVESHSQNPILPMSFFKDRAICVSLVIGFLSSAVMFASAIYIPYFVQGVLGRSATTSGAVTVPMTVALMVTSNIVGVAATTKSTWFRVLNILAFICGTAGSLLLSFMGVNAPYISVIIYMIILGGGIGVTMPIVGSNVQNAAPIEQLAAATGATQFFRTIGQTIASAIYGTIMTSAMASGFLSLDLSAVPEGIRSALRNPQVITDTAALSHLVSSVPADQSAAVQTAVAGAKNVLMSGIHQVFLFSAILSAVGLILSFFFKGAPMKIVHLHGPDSGEAPSPLPPESASE